MESFLFIVLLLMAVFLILLVLVQRGRGGGLAGALGGPGGSSAFGAKAGDTFTKITVYAAGIWIVTCIAASYWATHRSDALGSSDKQTVSSTIDLSTPADENESTGAGAVPPSEQAPAGEVPAEEAPAEE